LLEDLPMNKPVLSRKQFLNLGLGLLGTTLLAESCAPATDAPVDAGGTGGKGTGGSGAGTGGAGTGGAGTGGAGTGGAGTGGAGTGGAGTGGRNGSGGSASGGSGTGSGGRGTGGDATGSGGRGTGGSGTGTGGRGTGGGGGGGGASCSAAIQAAISENHMHVLMIPLADIMAGTEKCYDAKGTATHSHYVTLTTADFTMLKSGGVVKKFSCNGGDHQYVLSCGTVPAAVAPTCTATGMEGSTPC
jgi:hypothetical protein